LAQQYSQFLSTASPGLRAGLKSRLKLRLELARLGLRIRDAEQQTLCRASLMVLPDFMASCGCSELGHRLRARAEPASMHRRSGATKRPDEERRVEEPRPRNQGYDVTDRERRVLRHASGSFYSHQIDVVY